MMIARIVDVGTSDHMRVEKLNQLNSSSRGCKSPTYLHSGTQMLMFAHIYFHRLVFLQKNKYKGGRKASLFFEARLTPGFFCPGIRELSRTGTQVHEQGRKNMALERTRTQ